MSTKLEPTSLIEERLAFLLGQLADGGSLAPKLLGVDLELLVRELCDQVLHFEPMHDAFPAEVLADPPLLEGALRVLEQIATSSCERHSDAPQNALAKYALDYLIIPLTRYRELPDLWPRARLAAERLCDTLALSNEVELGSPFVSRAGGGRD